MNQYRPLCESCERTVQPIVACSLTSMPGRRPIMVYAAGAYTGALQTLVLAKLRGCRVMTEQLGLMVAERAPQSIVVDALIPVPLYWSRRIRRGYNQAEVVAQALSQKYGAPVWGVVRKIRNPKQQMVLTGEERVNGPRGAFALSSGAEGLKGKHIVLVDDVMTTGATLREMVSVLSPLRPASISVIVACRVVD